MMNGKLHIRPCRRDDRDAIAMVHRSAFDDEHCLEIVHLVNDLLDDETAKPILSLVAEVNDEVVGHALFTSVSVEPATTHVASMILAPIGVTEPNQRRGVGSRLIRDGLCKLKSQEVRLVFVLGYPEYYRRFGFRPAGVLGFQPPHPIAAEHAEAWMVLELSPGAIKQNGGTIRCSRVLNQPQHWRE